MKKFTYLLTRSGIRTSNPRSRCSVRLSTGDPIRDTLTFRSHTKVVVGLLARIHGDNRREVLTEEWGGERRRGVDL